MKTRALQLTVGLLIAAGLAACATNSAERLSDHDRALTLIQAADGALVEKDPTGALQYLKEAERYDPDIAELYHSQALAYYQKNDLESAIISARKALGLKPDYSDANNTLGRYLLEKGSLKEAETYLIRAASDPLYRDSFRPLTNLGILYYRKDDMKNAERFLNRAIATNSDFSCIAYYYRGHIRIKEGRVREAIDDYEKSVKKLCGGYGDAHYALGVAFEKNRQYDKARKKFIEIQERYPGSDLSKKASDHLRYIP